MSRETVVKDPQAAADGLIDTSSAAEPDAAMGRSARRRCRWRLGPRGTAAASAGPLRALEGDWARPRRGSAAGGKVHLGERVVVADAMSRADGVAVMGISFGRWPNSFISCTARLQAERGAKLIASRRRSATGSTPALRGCEPASTVDRGEFSRADLRHERVCMSECLGRQCQFRCAESHA